MGSLTSRPKVPQQTRSPQVIYVPSPQPHTPVTTGNTGGGSSTGGSDNTANADEVRAEAREQNLLSRSRGRLGTVQTSFRGLLSLAGGNAGRKTLLGE